MEKSDVVPEDVDGGEPEEDQGELEQRLPGEPRHAGENRGILTY